MRSFQQMILDRLEELAEKRDLECVNAQGASNTGRVIGLAGFTPVVTAAYHFQPGHNRVEFNCDRTRSAGKLGTVDGYLFSEEESAKIAAMFARWESLLDEAVGK